MTSKILRLIGKLFTDDVRYPKNNSGKKAAGSVLLLSAFLCVILCSVSTNPWFVTSILAGLLLILASRTPEQIAAVLRPTLIAVFFAALITLPAAFMGSPRTFSTITMKTAESVMLLAMAAEQLGWKGMTQAASSLHLPDLFIMTLDTAVRYLHILGRFAVRMNEAVSLRQVGEKNWKTAGTGGILGTTFLKSQRMAQMNTEAMTCRCFDGTYKHLYRHRFNVSDAAVIAADAAVIVLFVCLQSAAA
ncbi:MAG: energy-coupling factor transporter transmembrane component T [Lachnospiraceae bacterium]|jgi:cobalt/nickel transport system permease protein